MISHRSLHIILVGNYIMLMWDSPLFDASKETSDSALTTFKAAFPAGFAWEVLEVQSGRCMEEDDTCLVGVDERY